MRIWGVFYWIAVALVSLTMAYKFGYNSGVFDLKLQQLEEQISKLENIAEQPNDQ